MNCCAKAVYEDLPPSGRRAVHRAFADLLLEESRGYAVAAPHVIASAARDDGAAAAQVLRKAAHEVVDTMAVTSVSFIRQAWDLIGRDHPDWAQIGVEAVEILGAARQFTEATKVADLLLDARIPAELHGRVRLILLPRLWATGQLAELGDRTREPSGAPAIDARFAAYRALAEGAEAPACDDPIAAVIATAAAAQLAHRVEDRRRAQSLFASARVASQDLSGDGAPESEQLAARELLALARIDDIDGALNDLNDKTRFSSSWQAPQLALLRAQFALGAGRVDESLSAATTATELMAELHDRAFQEQLRELLAMLAMLRGDKAEARTQLAAATEAGTDPAMVRALIADSDGDPRGAAGVIAAIRQSGTIWPEEWLVAAVVSAHDRDDCETVRAGTDLLSELADRNPDIASAVGAHQLADALSTKDYLLARVTLSTSPRLLLAARAEEEFGRFALDAGDRTAAVTALDTAHDRYAELGAGAAATRVQRVLQTAGVRRRRWAAVPRRPEAGWDALTGMERRVALLIADGHTNRSAAEQLVLSSSTISTHLRAVFSKLDVHSRVQLANLVQRQDN
jgi:DNA-binding CsgD family transcriptional regulator